MCKLKSGKPLRKEIFSANSQFHFLKLLKFLLEISSVLWRCDDEGRRSFLFVTKKSANTLKQQVFTSYLSKRVENPYSTSAILLWTTWTLSDLFLPKRCIFYKTKLFLNYFTWQKHACIRVAAIYRCRRLIGKVASVIYSQWAIDQSATWEKALISKSPTRNKIQAVAKLWNDSDFEQRCSPPVATPRFFCLVILHTFHCWLFITTKTLH